MRCLCASLHRRRGVCASRDPAFCLASGSTSWGNPRWSVPTDFSGEANWNCRANGSMSGVDDPGCSAAPIAAAPGRERGKRSSVPPSSTPLIPSRPRRRTRPLRRDGAEMPPRAPALEFAGNPAADMAAQPEALDPSVAAGISRPGSGQIHTPAFAGCSPRTRISSTRYLI